MTDSAQHTTENAASAFGDELPAGSELFGGAYTIEKYLNSGGFGITYLARDSLNRQVVIKECFPSAMCYRNNKTVRLRSRNADDEFETILELFEKEARALSELSHPYVVGVHQIFHDNSTAYMAIDFVDGCDLLQVIEENPERLQPADVHELLLRCLEAVEYIHQSDVLHRDISPDNILLDKDGFPVFIDFGAARESATRVSRVLSKVLTVKDGYSPQEFYMQGSEQVYASDLYALAATFYHLLTGAPPPSSHTRMATVAGDQDDPFVPLDKSMVEGYPQHFLDAINTNLALFPNDRLPSAEAWRDVIDLERRRKILLDMAEEDRGLEEKVQALVAEYRRELRAAELAAKAPKPEPKAVAKTVEKKRKRKLATFILEEPINAEGGPSRKPAPVDDISQPVASTPPDAIAPPPPNPAATRVLTPEEAAKLLAAKVPPLPPVPTEGSEDAAAVVAAESGRKSENDRPKSRGLRKLLTGTKDMIMGQSKARYE